MSGDVLDIFSWFVLALLGVSGLVLFVVIAMLPGRIARRRGHAYADAVNVAGWLGALLAGILWPLALVWAFATPRPDPAPLRTEAAGGEGR